MKIVKRVLSVLTPQAQCVRTLTVAGAGKIAREWDAESEQALIDCLAKVPELPVDGVYPAQVIEWAEVKTQFGM